MDKKDQQDLFQRICEQHKSLLFKVARTYCSNDEDRQDLIQEMMIHIWQALPRFNNLSKISTWLYRIVLNVAISFIRKNAKRVQHTIALAEQDDGIAIDDKSEADLQFQLLEQCIGELKELDKAIMLLFLEDKSHAEIADILGMSVSNIGTKISRIKKILKMKFSNLNQ